MAKDLRHFLKDYEDNYPEDVVHINKEVSCNQEITAIVAGLERKKKYPMLIFHKVVNSKGVVSKLPVATNILASRIRRARLCGSTFDGLGKDIYNLLTTKKIKPIEVSKSVAPVKEVIKTDDGIDLYDFPVLVHNANDAGYYLSAGFVTTHDPDTNIDNCAIQRGWINEKDKIRIWIEPTMHNGINLQKHEVKNKDMRVAIWQGHHPLAYIGGLAKLPYPGSHFDAIGGALGEPLRLVKSETLGDDFLVPADAEIVIEGVVKANERYPEGPFGETARYFGGKMDNPQLSVTAVTHRKDAIWYDVVAGWADHAGSGGSSFEGQIWAVLKPLFPSLKRVFMPLSGVGRLHAYLQFSKPFQTEARRAILVTLSLFGGFIKHVFAFDEDVDIFDEQEVMWAIATRSQWDQDVIVTPRIKIKGIDPSATLGGVNCGGGIDCTKSSYNKKFEDRIYVSSEILEKMKLEDYLTSETLSKLKTENM